MNTTKLLDVLRQNARLSNAEIAVMLGETEQAVANEIARLEREGIIIGYSAIIDEEKADDVHYTLQQTRRDPKDTKKWF